MELKQLLINTIIDIKYFLQTPDDFSTEPPGSAAANLGIPTVINRISAKIPIPEELWPTV